MIEVKKGDIYYYVFNLFHPLIWAILQVRRDYAGDHGLGVSFSMLKSNKFINDPVISANQLDGVNIWGFKNFITKDKKQVIQMIFEGNKK